MANEFKVKKGLIVDGSSTVLDIQGTQGQLFSVTDSLTGDLFSVSDVSGIPIFNVNSSGLSTFDGDVTVDGGDFNLTKQNSSPIITMLYDGTNPAANTLLHYLNFQVDYSGSHQNWGNIEHRTTSSGTRTKLNFNVKSTSGSVLNALSLDGTTDGTTATFAGSINLSDSQPIKWGAENILSHNGTQTYLGDASSASVLTLSGGNATITGNLQVTGSSGDTLTLTKSTTEPSLRIEGDTDKDFVITVSGELLTFTQDDGATDILTLDHDTKNASFLGHVKIASAKYLEFSAMGKLINLNVPSWNTGAKEHNLLYSGWTSSTADYLSIKVAGNSTSGHGNLIIGDNGLWYGTMDTEDNAAATDSATNPNGGSNRFRVDSSGNGTFVGTVKGTTYLVNHTSAAGIGASLGDINSAELGPGYLSLSRDDTTEAAQIVFEKDDVEHTRLVTGADFFAIDTAKDIILDADGGDIIFKDAGTEIGRLDLAGGLAIKSSVSDADFFIQGSDGGSAINALQIDMSAGGNAIFLGSVTVGNQAVTSSTTNHENVLRIKGKNNYSDGTTWYGTYGQILLHSDTNMTGSARRFLITNAYENNKFAIVRSVDGNTDPVVNSTGSGVNSGTADFVINNSGNATFSGDVTASSGTGHFSVVNASAYQLNGTYIVDSSRNLVNINDITASQLTIDDYIYHAGDSDTYIYFTDNNIKLRAGGDDRLELATTYAKFSNNISIATSSTPRYQLDLAKLNNAAQTDYLALGVNNGPGTGDGTALGTGIVWKANYSGYSKRSAGIMQVAEGNYFRSGLAFYTNNATSTSSDWIQRMDLNMDGKLTLDGSDANVGTVLDVQGTAGQLFSVTNSLTGDLFSVSDVSGIPILNVNSSGQVNVDGNLEIGGIADPTVKIKSLTGGDPTLIFDAQAANRSARIKFYDNGSTVGGFIDYLHNGDKMNFGSGSSSSVTMTVGDGAVGIGVQTPLDYYADDLVVLGGDEKGITIANSSTTGKSYLCFADSTSGAAAYTGYVAYDHNDNSLSFATNGGNNRLTINNTGLSTFYGGGTQAKFQSTGSYSDIIFTNSSGTGGFINFGGTTSFNVYVGGGSAGNLEMSLTNTGTLTVAGDVVAFGSPSDIRLKENIKPIESALDKVMNLKGVTFDWKDKEDALDRDGNPVKLKKWKNDIGFIAQEVKEVVPELVRENKEGMLSVRHQGVTPILLEAIKELKAEIEELKKHKCNCNGSSK